MKPHLALGLGTLLAAAACSGSDEDTCGSACEARSLEAGYTLSTLLYAVDVVLGSAGDVSTTLTLDVTDSALCTSTAGTVHYGGTVVLTSNGFPTVEGDIDLVFTGCSISSMGVDALEGSLHLTDAFRDGGEWTFDASADAASFSTGSPLSPCAVDLHGEQSDDFVYTEGIWCGMSVEPLDFGDG